MRIANTLLLVSICLTFSLVACDSQMNPADDVPPTGTDQIELIAQLPDTTIYDSETFVVWPGSYFRHTQGQSMAYSVASDRAGLRVSVDSDNPAKLVFDPIENLFINQAAEVIVTASDVDGNSLNDTLQVSVTDDCPRPNTDPGLDDYFPLDFPIEWEFAYEKHYSDDDVIIVSSGIATYRVSGDALSPCTDFTRIYSSSTHIEGTMVERPINDPTWSEPVPFSQTYSGTLLERETTVDSDFGVHARRYLEISQPDTVMIDGGPWCAIHRAHLTRNVGPTYMYVWCASYTTYRYESTTTWTR